MIWTCAITLKSGVVVDAKLSAPDCNTARILFEGMYPERLFMGYPYANADDQID